MTDLEILNNWIQGARDLDLENAKSTSASLSLVLEIKRIVKRIITVNGLPAQVYSVERSSKSWTRELFEDVTQDVVLGLLKKKQFRFFGQDNGYFLNIAGFRSLLTQQVYQTLLDVQRPTIEGNLSGRAVEILSKDPFVCNHLTDGRKLYELRNVRGLERELNDELVRVAANIVLPHRELADVKNDIDRLPRIMTDKTLAKVLEQICTALMCPIDRSFLDRVFRYCLHDLVPNQQSIDEILKITPESEDDDEINANWLKGHEPTEYQEGGIRHQKDQFSESQMSSSEKVWKGFAMKMAEAISDDLKMAMLVLGGVAGLRQAQIGEQLQLSAGRISQLQQEIAGRFEIVRNAFVADLDSDSLKEFETEETQRTIMLMIARELNLMGYRI